jgi:colanic acid/amylovoran biosynthesis protein
LEDSSFSFYTHLVQLYLAKKLSKKVVLSPMSIGPTNSKINTMILKFVLKGIDIIFVREMFSKKYCESMGLASTLSNDLAFEKFNHKIVTRSGVSNQTLYVTVINWNFPDTSNPSCYFERYIDSLVKVSASLSQKHNLKVKIIEQVSSDLPAINIFRKRLSDLGVSSDILGSNMSPIDIMDELSKAKLVIASRFHSAIFSLNVGVPVIAISYLPKTTGMLSLYEANELFFEINQLSYQELLDKCNLFITDENNYYDSRKKLSKGILKITDPFKYFVHSLFSSR